MEEARRGHSLTLGGELFARLPIGVKTSEAQEVDVVIFFQDLRKLERAVTSFLDFDPIKGVQKRENVHKGMAKAHVTCEPLRFCVLTERLVQLQLDPRGEVRLGESLSLGFRPDWWDNVGVHRHCSGDGRTCGCGHFFITVLEYC
jgi:hypothetical protein